MNGQKYSDCDLKEVKNLDIIQSFGTLIVVNSQDVIVQHSTLFSNEDLISTALCDWSSDVHALVTTFRKDGLIAYRDADTPWGPKTLTISPLPDAPQGHLTLEFEPPSEQPPNTIEFLQAEVESSLGSLESMRDPIEIMRVCCDIIATILPLDRLMGYKFDHKFDGEVVIESNQIPLEVSLLGLKFPNYEIPLAARSMFGLNPVRCVENAEAPSIRVVGGAPIDMTRLFLRGAHSTHLMYLTKLCVKTSVSVAIHYRQRLWGMLICHTYTQPIRVHSWARKCLQSVAEAATTVIGNTLDLQQSVHIKELKVFVKSAQLHGLPTLRLIAEALGCSAVYLKSQSCARQALYMSDFAAEANPLKPSTAIIMCKAVQSAPLEGAEIADESIKAYTRMPNHEYSPLYCGAALIQIEHDFLLLLRPESIERWAGGVNDKTPANYRWAFSRLVTEKSGQCKTWIPDREWLRALKSMLQNSNMEHNQNKQQSGFRPMSCVWPWRQRVETMLPPPPQNPVVGANMVIVADKPTAAPHTEACKTFEKHILVCDDNSITRRLLVRLIEKLDPESRCVPLEDGLDVIRHYIDNCRTSDQVTHIISDRHMNFLNGDDTIEFIRKIERRENRTRPLIVFMLSSDTNTDVVDKKIVQQLLIKPIKVADLKLFLDLPS